jgi:hypothetical protein
MSLLKLWFIRNPVLVSYSICVRQGSSDLSGSQSALTCLCVCARAQLGLREFNKAEITLHLLRTLRLYPQLSAAAHFHGLVDYNKTAVAPPGYKIIAHEKPGKDALGRPTGKMDIPWAQQCIITDVKTSTSLQRLANASWTHSSSSHTIIKCHSCLPLTD